MAGRRLEQLESLAEKVRKMRFWQREYFAKKEPDALSKAKDLEKKVDRQLTELEEGQQRLFDE